MPHKHNDINHGVDPELIRRYLAGELDDKAMHLLEKQALDDPFLAEALEGFAEYAPDQQLNLADLESRLEQRVVVKKERKLPVYYRWAAAAAVLLLAGIGVMKMWPLPEKKEIAKATVKQDTVTTGTYKNESANQSEALANNKPAASDVAKQVSIPDVSVPREEKEAVVQSDKRPAAAVQSEIPAKAFADESSNKEEPLLAKLKKVETVRADTVAADNVYAAAPVSEKAPEVGAVLSGRATGVMVSRSAPVKKRVLTGKVTDNNKNPLPAVSVAVNNTNNGTITDKDGYFAIPVDSTTNVQLNVNYIGYESKRLKVDNNQNNLSIAMNESHSALDEVVVSGYGTRQKSRLERIAYQAPVPGEGFDSYQQYLVKHVKYPASAGNIKGVVKVGFTVKSDGRMENFKVITKLQGDCDAEAIRVIKEGPAWLPASDGKSARVQVDVPFNP
jgi:hypothetical protein